MNIFENPFYKLGASTRNNRQQITDLAEDKAFYQQDTREINEARNNLIIPSKRLAAEIRWFPGVRDSKVKELIEFFSKLNAGQKTPGINISDFRNIALLNFAVYTFRFHKFKTVAEIAKSLLAINSCFETTTLETVSKVINNDRKAAGFPPASGAELENEMRNYRGDIIKVLDETLTKLPREKYILLAEELSEKFMNEDKHRNSFLLGDMLDNYELGTISRIEELKTRILDAISHNSEIEHIFERWRYVSKPLINTAKSRGTENITLRKHGEEFLIAARNQINELIKKGHQPKEALDLIITLQKNLSDVSSMLSQALNNDITALKSLVQVQEELERMKQKQHDEWARSIYYEKKIGGVFGYTLRISEDGILWNAALTPLDEITGICWGAVQKFVNVIVNGIHIGTDYNGTDYKITFETEYNIYHIDCPEQITFDEVVQKLWTALAVPISKKILTQLKDGEMLTIGEISFNDSGVFLNKQEGYGRKFFAWNDGLITFSHEGYYYIHGYDDYDLYTAQASYLDDMNTHILNFLVSQFLEKFESRSNKLSGMLIFMNLGT